MNELLNKFAARAAAAPLCSKRYRHVWTQEQSGVTYGDGVNTWPAVYEISTTAASTALTVNVLIGATDGGGGFTAEVAKRWAGAIKRVWSDKAAVSVTQTTAGVAKAHKRRILFEIAWNDVNAEYTVQCRPTPGMAGLIAAIDAQPTPADRSAYVQSLGVAAVTAAAYDIAWPTWKKTAMLRDVDRDNVFHGTPNMLEWGADDSEAVPHEFGHTIGLPDEYLTTQYNGIALDAAIYNQPPFGTKSIMNNTVSSRGSTLYPRHFSLIATDFRDLMSTSVAPGGVYGAPTVTML